MQPSTSRHSPLFGEKNTFRDWQFYSRLVTYQCFFLYEYAKNIIITKNLSCTRREEVNRVHSFYVFPAMSVWLRQENEED